jgi:hypothetical protein
MSLGKLMLAASIIEESESEVLILAKDAFEPDLIKEGEEIWIASTNEKAKILKKEGNKITLDKKVCSANEDKILKGEIIIFPEH